MTLIGAAPPRTGTMAFLVHGRDAAGVGERLMTLASAHWDYIDRFAERLIARGPTSSDDGEEHTGSVHVVSMSDAAEARRFANEEPYQQAGLYAEVSITRFENLLGRTMWERPPPVAPPQSTFLLARVPAFSPSPEDTSALRAALESQADVWAFAGLLVSDDGRQCTGAAASADLSPDLARRAFCAAFAPLGLERAPIETSRWRRGGRHRP